MQDALDIVDTAVKIGLGAFITAIATYSTTKLKSDKDRELDVSRKHRDLLERVSTLAFDAGSSVSKALQCASAAIAVSDLDERKKLTDDAAVHSMRVHEHLNSALALSALLGYAQLTELLLKFSSLATTLHFLVRYEPQRLPKMDELVAEMNEVQTQLIPAIRAAYQGAS